MSTTFNTLDSIFFIFTAIFVITATFRGFIKEIFAIFTWIAALALSYFLAPYITDLLAPYFKSKMAIDLVARGGVFVLVFLIITFSTSNMCRFLQDKMPTIFDRSLGLLFGFGKTLLIFGVLYSIYFNAYEIAMGSKLQDTKKEPDWLQQAKSRSLIKASGEMLDPFIKKFLVAAMQNFDQVLPKPEDLLKDKINEIINDQSTRDAGDAANLDDDLPPTDSGLEKLLNTGYTKKNIEKLNQLMEIINK